MSRKIILIALSLFSELSFSNAQNPCSGVFAGKVETKMYLKHH